jgi:hypothetical protein
MRRHMILVEFRVKFPRTIALVEPLPELMALLAVTHIRIGEAIGLNRNYRLSADSGTTCHRIDQARHGRLPAKKSQGK